MLLQGNNAAFVLQYLWVRFCPISFACHADLLVTQIYLSRRFRRFFLTTIMTITSVIHVCRLKFQNCSSKKICVISEICVTKERKEKSVWIRVICGKTPICRTLRNKLILSELAKFFRSHLGIWRNFIWEFGAISFGNLAMLAQIFFFFLSRRFRRFRRFFYDNYSCV